MIYLAALFMLASVASSPRDVSCPDQLRSTYRLAKHAAEGRIKEVALNHVSIYMKSRKTSMISFTFSSMPEQSISDECGKSVAVTLKLCPSEIVETEQFATDECSPTDLGLTFQGLNFAAFSDLLIAASSRDTDDVALGLSLDARDIRRSDILWHIDVFDQSKHSVADFWASPNGLSVSSLRTPDVAIRRIIEEWLKKNACCARVARDCAKGCKMDAAPIK